MLRMGDWTTFDQVGRKLLYFRAGLPGHRHRKLSQSWGLETTLVRLKLRLKWRQSYLNMAY